MSESWVGRVLDDCYRLRHLIARGGMGEVYEAIDLRDGRRVALKVLRRDLSEDSAFRRRAAREAEIALSLESDQIAKLLAKGETRRRLWLVFEFLEGESLDGRLQRDNTLEIETAAWVVEQTLLALRVIHDAGVIHRDIHPGNIFLEEGNRRLRVLDFGVAKREAMSSGMPVTNLEDILGNPRYMSPEQFAGAGNADARSDLYGVGVVAYRILSGRLPFEHPDVHEMIERKRTGRLPLLASTTRRSWPDELERWLQTALAPLPEARFASAQSALDGWRVAAGVARDHQATEITIHEDDEDTLVLAPRRPGRH